MKVPVSKQIAFLQKIISDTMTNTGCWERQMSNSVASAQVFDDVSLDKEGVFSYRFPRETGGSFWLAMGADGRVMGALGADYTHMELFDCDNEEIRVLLTRLFYLLFDRGPSANKIIDDFLSLDQTADNTDANT